MVKNGDVGFNFDFCISVQFNLPMSWGNSFSKLLLVCQCESTTIICVGNAKITLASKALLHKESNQVSFSGGPNWTVHSHLWTGQCRGTCVQLHPPVPGPIKKKNGKGSVLLGLGRWEQRAGGCKNGKQSFFYTWPPIQLCLCPLCIY